MASNPIEQAREQHEADVAVNTLVARAREGNMAAFDGLVTTFSARIFNIAYGMTNSREEADDLSQEIFVKVYNSLRKFRGDSAFSTWLYALAVNMCRSRLRRLRRIARFETVRLSEERGGNDDEISVDPPDPGEWPDEAVRRREVQTVIAQAVAALPPDARTMIVLRDMQGLEYGEIAAALKCSLGTVKSRLARARMRLRDLLVREGITCAANN